jgi:phage terminase small subunit
MAERRIKPQEHITDRRAKAMFKKIVQEFREVNGEPNDADLSIINDIALLEQTKILLIEDIEKRGVSELFINGTQEMIRENKSVDKIIKFVEQQRKLLSELKLTPASKKILESAAGKDGDDFDDF